jgi:hypothetical protein
MRICAQPLVTLNYGVRLCKAVLFQRRYFRLRRGHHY